MKTKTGTITIFFIFIILIGCAIEKALINKETLNDNEYEVDSNYFPSSNTINGGFCTQYKNFIYYSDGNGIYCTDKNFKNIKKISDLQAQQMNIVNDRLYFANINDINRLYSIALDGSNLKKETDFTVAEVLYHNKDLYIANRDEISKMYKLNTENIKLEKLDVEIQAVYLSFYENNLCYMDWSQGFGQYKKLNLDNNEISEIRNDINGSIIIGKDAFYYGYDFLYKISLDGSIKTKLPSKNPYSICIYGDYIYYLEAPSNYIYKIKSDGTQKTLICNEKVYFINVVDEDIIFAKKGTPDSNETFLIKKGENGYEINIL